MLTLDQLKRRGKALANRFYICEENEETIEHLLVHCKKVKMLWDLFLLIVGTSWVLHSTIMARSNSGEKIKKKKGWQPPFAYFRLYGGKEIWWRLSMVLPQLKG